jgi:GT2 family glycosyltransferase
MVGNRTIESSAANELASVVVLTWNGKEHLEECLSALLAQTYPEKEIILVDNASSDGTVSFVRERFPSVRLVANEKNLGYTGGNNAGIRAARGVYIALINNDTRADPAWLSALVAAMRGDPSCAMVAGKILSYGDHRVIDNVGHVFYRDGTFRGRGRLEADRGQYDRPEEILSPSGCALLFRRAALDRVGLFDDDFFIYGDDAELSLRLRLNGWRALYVPTAVVYHKYSASTGAYSPFKAFLVERNRIWLTIKYFPIGDLLLSPAFAAWRMFLQAYGVAAQKGAAGRFARQYSAGALALIAVKANLAAFRGLPRMWRKRREMKKIRRVGAAEFNGWFKRFGLSARELAWKE